MINSGNRCGGKNGGLGTLLLNIGSAEAFAVPFACAPARYYRRMHTHVKSIELLPSLRKSGFSPENKGQNVRRPSSALPPHASATAYACGEPAEAIA